MKVVVCCVIFTGAGLTAAVVAVAGRPTVPWHPEDMETAIRALG